MTDVGAAELSLVSETSGGRALRRAAAVLFVLGVVGSSGGTVCAEEGTPGAPAVEEILVTATRTPRAAFESPYSAEVVGQAEIDEKLYRTLPEALREVPAVMVQKTSLGQGSPYIRGFTGFRNLLLIDGIRLNNSVFREGPNQYWGTLDPLSMERVEIVKGPSSVLYGSDAVGGTVHTIAKGPYGSLSGLPAGGRAYYRGATAERSHTGHVEVGVEDEGPVSFYADASVKSFGDLQLGGDHGRQENVGYQEYSLSFKGEVQLSPNLELVAAHQALEQDDVPRTHSTVFGKSYKGTTVGSDLKRDLNQRRHLSYLQLHADGLGSLVQGAKLSLSWHRQSENEDRVRGNGRRRMQGFDVDTLGLWAQLESESPIGELIYGFDYYRDEVDSYSTSNPIQGPVGDESSYDLFGVYVQDTVAMSERVEIIAGGRFTYAEAEADSVVDAQTGEAIALSEDWDELVGSLRILGKVIPDRLNVFAGVSQGFRAPNLSDLTRLDSARSGELETPSPSLDPEHYISYEIGVKAKLANVSAQLAVFYMDIEDMIVRVPTGNEIEGELEVTKLNAGDGFVQGIEADARWRPCEDWSLFGAFSWIDGEVDTFPTSDPIKVREPLDRLMPVTGLAGVRWQPHAYPVWAELTGAFVSRQDDLSTRDRRDTQRIPPNGTPGYATVALYTGWQVSERLTLSLALENIADNDYRVHGSGTNEPGFNAVASVDARL